MESPLHRLIALAAAAATSLASEARDFSGYVVDETDAPLPIASVDALHSSAATVTDDRGYFELKGLDPDEALVISYAAYNSDTIYIRSYASDNGNYVRLQPIRLASVVVNGKNTLLNSRVTALKTQTLGVGEICKAACCNLGESFQTNASVDVSYSDAATGARTIKLLGLSSNYVMMTLEKFPNFTGLAQPFGLAYLPSTWMQSIQISKGASSVVDGYESITGQINVEMKKPQTADMLSAAVFVDNHAMMSLDLDGAIKVSDHVSTMLLGHYQDNFMSHDGNGDTFMDMPRVRAYDFMNRWYASHGHWRGIYGVKYIGEDRRSGQIAKKVKGSDPWTSDIRTNRFEAFAKNGIILDEEHDRSIGLMAQVQYHDLDSHFGMRELDAKELNTYFNGIYQTEITEEHSIKAGLSHRFDNMRTTANYYDCDSNADMTTGLFAEYTAKPTHAFTAVLGLREDYSTRYKKAFFTPRLHLKFDPTEEVQIRASVGRGARQSHTMAENVALLVSSRKIIGAEVDVLERAWNYGASVQYSPETKRPLTMSVEWFYTQFGEHVALDLDTDPHAAIFSVSRERSYSNVMQLEVTYELIPRLDVTAAYRRTQSRETIGGTLRQRALTGTNKGVVTMSYQTKLKKWQFDFTAQINGGGRMPDPDAESPLWERRYGAYPLFNCQVTRRFRRFDVFLGCENIGGYTQSDPIISASNPWSEEFDGSMMYAPVEGRKFYVNARFTLPQK